jgi:hypothetical protein
MLFIRRTGDVGYSILQDKADADELLRLNMIAHAIGDDLVHVETFVMQARPCRICD